MATAHDVALLRLVAQRVAGPPAATPAAAVGHLTAVQAQDLPGAVTSVALRTQGRSRAAVHAAFDAGEVVRSWPMRGTLHLVVAEDLPWMLRLMAPRPLAAAARRRSGLGLEDADVARARDVAGSVLAGGALSRAELLDAWESAGQPTSGGRGYHLIAHLAQTGVVCLGPMRGEEQLFVLVDEWLRHRWYPEGEEALGELALRYVRGHGPATAQDLARWSSLSLTQVRTGLAVAAGELETVAVEDTIYHLDPATPQLLAEHRQAAEGLHLLPGFDEVVLGYADRSATVPAQHADRIVPGGNGVFRPMVVRDGVAVGTWRVTGRGGKRRVEAEPFEPGEDLTAAVQDAYERLP